jgi:predicted dehydrogenase
MDKSFNVAIIGAGKMGRSHARTWVQAGHIVRSITDLNEAAARQLASVHNVNKLLTDYKAAIEDKEIDIVSVCVPAGMHAEIAIFAAQQGKHIMCEKPVALTLEAAHAMEDAVSRAGVRCALGFQLNYGKNLDIISGLIKEGAFGNPLMIQLELIKEVRPNLAMHNKFGNNGPIVDCACHDWLFWETAIGSKPKNVFARGGIIAKNRPELAGIKELAIDTASIVLEFESGDVASMNVSWGLAKNTKLFSRFARVIGPEGAAELEKNETIKLLLGDREEIVSAESNLDPRLNMFNHLADCIANNMPVRYGIRTGIEQLTLSMAILESISSGKVVDLDYKTVQGANR